MLKMQVIGLVSKDKVHLVIQCPLCGKIHLHGAGEKGDKIAYGDRGCHCSSGSTSINLDYTIIQPPSKEVEALLRENIKGRVKREKGISI